MSSDKLALAYWQAVEDLSELLRAMDLARDGKRAELNAIERLSTDERVIHVSEHLRLLQEVRVLTSTRLEIANVRALIRTRANECAPDLIGRMARAVAGAALGREGSPPRR
ncbi:MAG: hypothetical protein AB7P97_20295 [Hyphomonadaceae bacterium]